MLLRILYEHMLSTSTETDQKLKKICKKSLLVMVYHIVRCLNNPIVNLFY